MIPINTLINNLNTDLNALLGKNDLVFAIVPDGGDHAIPTRTGNDITRYIDGVARIVDSALTVINGLYVATQTVSVVVAVSIDQNKPMEESFTPVRQAISQLTQTPKATAMQDENGSTFMVTSYGTQPSAGDIMQRSAIGESITYAFTLFYSFIQNGISSLNMSMTFEGESVPFTELTPSITPVMESGVMSESENNGAVNYPTAEAFQITLTVPALTDSILTQELTKYLLTKERAIYTVTLNMNGFSSEYKMLFAPCNLTARGVEGIGLSITLVEALEGANNGAV